MAFKFERLEVWHRSIEFADLLFGIADKLPKHYQFSLGEQLRRASLSVPTNIAEGTGRGQPKEASYFFRISKGSLYECVSLLTLIKRRGHLKVDVFLQIYSDADELARMITGLIKVQTR